MKFTLALTLLAGTAFAANQEAAAPQMEQAPTADAPTLGNLLDIMSKVVEAIGERVPDLQESASGVSGSLSKFKDAASEVKVGSLVDNANPSPAPQQ